MEAPSLGGGGAVGYFFYTRYLYEFIPLIEILYLNRFVLL